MTTLVRRLFPFFLLFPSSPRPCLPHPSSPPSHDTLAPLFPSTLPPWPTDYLCDYCRSPALLIPSLHLHWPVRSSSALPDPPPYVRFTYCTLLSPSHELLLPFSLGPPHQPSESRPDVVVLVGQIKARRQLGPVPVASHLRKRRALRLASVFATSPSSCLRATRYYARSTKRVHDRQHPPPSHRRPDHCPLQATQALSILLLRVIPAHQLPK